MIDTAQTIGENLLVLIGAAVALYAAYRIVEGLIDALPMRRDRRELIDRGKPVVAAALAVVWGVVVAGWILRHDPGAGQYAVILVVAVGIGVSWRMLRDVIEGVYFRSTRSFVEGDQVQVGEVRGRVQRLGPRSITIETPDGKLALVPYSRIASDTVFRAPAAERTSFHVFRVPLPAGTTLPEAKQRVREAALLCHWSSVAQPPQCIATGDGELEITVFALDSDRASEIERAVRDACH